MSPSTPGRVRSRECYPRNLREAMVATRLANAEESRHGLSKFRYIITCPIHEGLDKDLAVPILDSTEGVVITVAELLQRLPEDLRKLVLSS